MFDRLYRWVLSACEHKHATSWLAVVSFTESSFFPIPPDVMLAPMTLAQPRKAWFYATVTTVSSVLGGLLGYAIGYFLTDGVVPLLDQMGYLHAYETSVEWFALWGFWAIFLAGFTPIPYKVFTIASGVAGMALPVFIAGSLIGRGLRYFLIAGLVKFFGPKVQPVLERYVNTIGWVCVILVVFVIIYLKIIR